MASVEANKNSSLLISAMQYGRKLDSSIKYMYGVGAVEPRSANLRGSYNTFLGQDSQVVVINTTGIEQQASISVGAPKGDLSVQQTEFNVADEGVLTLSLGEPANTYGMVKVQPEAGAELAAWVLRVLPTADGSDIADIIPIQLR
jgi:hypothetical protein